MTRWLFESWISHFIECLKKGPGLNLINCHLIILDEHNLHVTLEVVKISMESRLEIVSLLSHTSHAFQPVACFKPFKTTFKKITNVWLLTNKNRPMEKQTLYEWTSEALQHALTPSNTRLGFRGTSIWPLDSHAARASMTPSIGFEEGCFRPCGGGVTDIGGGSTRMGIGCISILSEGDKVETRQTSHLDSNQTPNVGHLYGNSSESGSDAKPLQADENSNAT